MTDESTPQKRCSKCREIKPIGAFYKSKGRKDGLCPWCKACKRREYDANVEKISEQKRAHRAANIDVIREKDRARRAANIEVIRERDRARYAANIEARREKDRAYSAAHPEAIRKKNRAHYAVNAEKLREYSRAYRAANAELIREKDRTRYAANAELIREKYRARYATNAELIREKSRAYYAAYYAVNPDIYRALNQQRQARIKGNGGSFTAQELRHMRLTQGGFCTYCQEHHPRLAIDHIIPIKQGGRHEAANICLACRRCNSSKGNRTPHQWINRWYWRRRKDNDYHPLYD